MITRELSDAQSRLSKQFGLSIRTRRQELGYTQQKLADLIGVNRRAISELERGKGTTYLGLALSAAEVLGYAPLGEPRRPSPRKLPRL